METNVQEELCQGNCLTFGGNEVCNKFTNHQKKLVGPEGLIGTLF